MPTAIALTLPLGGQVRQVRPGATVRYGEAARGRERRGPGNEARLVRARRGEARPGMVHRAGHGRCLQRATLPPPTIHAPTMGIDQPQRGRSRGPRFPLLGGGLRAGWRGRVGLPELDEPGCSQPASRTDGVYEHTGPGVAAPGPQPRPVTVDVPRQDPPCRHPAAGHQAQRRPEETASGTRQRRGLPAQRPLKPRPPPGCGATSAPSRP